MARLKNPKMKMAKAMMTSYERENHTPPFNSMGWTKRSLAIEKRIQSKKDKNKKCLK